MQVFPQWKMQVHILHSVGLEYTKQTMSRTLVGQDRGRRLVGMDISAGGGQGVKLTCMMALG